MQRSNSVGIVGAGIAGLQLALHLQCHGVPITLYTDRTPKQICQGRLPNTVCRFAPTRDRERALGVEHWDEPEFGTFGIDFRIIGSPIAFQGSFSRPASFVDTRLYQATLLEETLEAGTPVVYGALQPADVERHSPEHALMVVASGRGQLADLFPRVPEQSPYAEPQRRLFAGLFHGLSVSDSADLAFCISPGHGEVFAFARS
jgi:Styrene monooxygenase A putative substrate binding domain